jgi:hypothetical protein
MLHVQFDSVLSLVNQLNCFINFNSVKKVGLMVIFPWQVNYQQIFDLLDHMPNLSEVDLDNWPMKESWLQVERGNSRVSSIKVRSIINTNFNNCFFLVYFSCLTYLVFKIDYYQIV